MNDNQKKEFIQDILNGCTKENSNHVLDRKEVESGVFLLHTTNENNDCFSVLEIDGVERFYVPENEEKSMLEWWERESLKRKGEEFSEIGKDAIGGGWVICMNSDIAKNLYLNFRLSAIGRYAEAECYKDVFFVVQQEEFDEEAAKDFVASLANLGYVGLFNFQIKESEKKFFPIRNDNIVCLEEEKPNSLFMNSCIGIGFFHFSSELDFAAAQSAYEPTKKLFDDPVYKSFRKNLNINLQYPFSTLTFGGDFNFGVLTDILEKTGCYVTTGEVLIIDSTGHLYRYLIRDGDVETYDLFRYKIN